MDENDRQDTDIGKYFTARIARTNSEELKITIPKEEKKTFEHKDKVKVILIEKHDKNLSEDNVDGDAQDQEDKKK